VLSKVRLKSDTVVLGVVSYSTVVLELQCTSRNAEYFTVTTLSMSLRLSTGRRLVGPFRFKGFMSNDDEDVAAAAMSAAMQSEAFEAAKAKSEALRMTVPFPAGTDAGGTVPGKCNALGFLFCFDSHRMIESSLMRAEDFATLAVDALPPSSRVAGLPPPAEAPIWTENEYDVISGRGSSVNAHPGNAKFRARCFARKAEFTAANAVAKRRIATEVVTSMMEDYATRFLRRGKDPSQPYTQMTKQEAIVKTAQVIRDYRRPDRLAHRHMMIISGKRRRRMVTTPMTGVLVPPPPTAPVIDCPPGVNPNDVLCGRGAYANGHAGNQQLRQLAIERKPQFDSLAYKLKRGVANDIIQILTSKTPPGRFLKKFKLSQPVDEMITRKVVVPPTNEQDGWYEMSEEEAVLKTCQVMRDIDRPDRKERDEQRKLRKLKKEQEREAEKKRLPGFSSDSALSGVELVHDVLQTLLDYEQQGSKKTSKKK